MKEHGFNIEKKDTLVGYYIIRFSDINNPTYKSVVFGLKTDAQKYLDFLIKDGSWKSIGNDFYHSESIGEFYLLVYKYQDTYSIV